MFQLRFTKSGRVIKLWQLLLIIAVVGVGLALLPERIGVPILLVIEATGLLAIVCLLAVVVFLKLTRK
jgi:hypothetical protein